MNGVNPIVVTAVLKSYGLPEPQYEYKFCNTRRWRFDIAFPDRKLAVEVQGGIFSGGRHVRGMALLKEYDKLNTAAAMGWRVMFVTPSLLCKKDFMDALRSAYEYKTFP